MAWPIFEPIIVRGNPPIEQLSREAGKWLYEPKYDGWRGFYYLNRSEALFKSKSGFHPTRFDPLAKKIRDKLKATSVVLDGELVAIDPKTGYSNFEDLTKARRPESFLAFDILYLNGRKLVYKPLLERKRILKELLDDKTGWIQLVSFTTEFVAELIQNAKYLNIEGLVAKKVDEAYDAHAHWYKILNSAYAEKKKDRAKIFNRAKTR